MIVIMSHIGCYVPAKRAKIPIFERIFSRIGTDEEEDGGIIEGGSISTFTKEMIDMAYIVGNMSDQRCLVLIDEIGRATSTIEGQAIAWALSEFLLLHPLCYTMFVTHFTKLTELCQLYPNVRNFHMAVTATSSSNFADGNGGQGDGLDSGILHFLHQLNEGSTSTYTRYGLKLARMIGFPKDILQDAEELVDKVSPSLELSTTAAMTIEAEDPSSDPNRIQFANRLLSLRYSTLDFQSLKLLLKSMKK